MIKNTLFISLKKLPVLFIFERQTQRLTRLKYENLQLKLVKLDTYTLFNLNLNNIDMFLSPSSNSNKQSNV